MGKKIVAGISVAADVAHLSLFDVRDRETKLIYLKEAHKDKDESLWYLDDVLNPRLRILKKTSKVSVALDSKSVILHNFPLDTTLNQAEQNEHVRWELSNIIPDIHADDITYDLHILKINARDQVAQVLVVAVMRKQISEIQKALAGKKIELHIADAAFFGAEQVLYSQYAESRSKTVALLYSVQNRVDIGIEHNGRLVNYGFTPDASAKSVTDMLNRLASGYSLNAIYCCGTETTPELLKSVQNAAGVNADILNPFRMNIKLSSFDGYEEMAGVKHRFAASAGVALRKR